VLLWPSDPSLAQRTVFAAKGAANTVSAGPKVRVLGATSPDAMALDTAHLCGEIPYAPAGLFVDHSAASQGTRDGRVGDISCLDDVLDGNGH
jgi:hypothetical protein